MSMKKKLEMKPPVPEKQVSIGELELRNLRAARCTLDELRETYAELHREFCEQEMRLEKLRLSIQSLRLINETSGLIISGMVPPPPALYQ